MLKRLLRYLRFSSRRVPELYANAAENYVNLVKSRVIGAVVVDEEFLLPPDASPEQRCGFLSALCAYFVARTDMELDNRGVPPQLREYVWSAIPEAVLDEMDSSGTHRTQAMQLILGQSGAFRGVIETHGPTNAQALAQTLLVMSKSSVPRCPTLDTAALCDGVSGLLAKYERYGRYLDALASHARGDA
jgi:hypothetical protein